MVSEASRSSPVPTSRARSTSSSQPSAPVRSCVPTELASTSAPSSAAPLISTVTLGVSATSTPQRSSTRRRSRSAARTSARRVTAFSGISMRAALPERCTATLSQRSRFQEFSVHTRKRCGPGATSTPMKS
jgi:hypothetical protein